LNQVLDFPLVFLAITKFFRANHILNHRKLKSKIDREEKIRHVTIVDNNFCQSLSHEIPPPLHKLPRHEHILTRVSCLKICKFYNNQQKININNYRLILIRYQPTGG